MLKLYHSEILRYLTLVCSLAIIDVAVFQLMVASAGIHSQVVVLLNGSVSTLLNWLGCRYLVFPGRGKQTHKELTQFLVVSLFAISLQSGVVALMMLSPMMIPGVARLGSMGVSFCFSFLLKQKIIYKIEH